MYNGLGLQTPRRSGTSGYVQSNKFFIKPKTNKVVVVDGGKGFKSGGGAAPNKDILRHVRKRKTQLKLQFSRRSSQTKNRRQARARRTLTQHQKIPEDLLLLLLHKGYATKEFAKQGVKPGELAIIFKL